MTRSRDLAGLLSAASDLATDVETAAAISTHASASDPHGDRAAATSAISTHASASDPHTGYVIKTGGSAITVSSGTTVPLTIQNNGTGNSFVVNDVASDTTSFIIDANGNVNVGGSLTASAGSNSLGSTTMTGLIVGQANAGGSVYASNDTGSFSVRSTGANSATMSFHRPGAYAVNMGLDSDNQFKIGGWSAGGSTDHFVLNFGTGLSVSSARANTAQSISDGRFRNTYTSTSAPSGGNDGDVWLTYIP